LYPVSLNNFGFIRTKLPSSLYKNLLKECLQAEHKNPPMVSGLTAKGVAPHYFLIGKSNLKNLTIFIHEMRKAYDKEFPGLGNTGVLSQDRPYCLDPVWINLQRKGQFVPAHVHDGVYSYTIWMKIPYDSKKEYPQSKPGFSTDSHIKKINLYLLKNKKLPLSKVVEYSASPSVEYSASPSAGIFQFSYMNIFGGGMIHKITLNKKDEGDIVLFPSKLQHLVYPFYTSSGVRISISGNIVYDVGKKV